MSTAQLEQRVELLQLLLKIELWVIEFCRSSAAGPRVQCVLPSDRTDTPCNGFPADGLWHTLDGVPFSSDTFVTICRQVWRRDDCTLTPEQLVWTCLVVSTVRMLYSGVSLCSIRATRKVAV